MEEIVDNIRLTQYSGGCGYRVFPFVLGYLQC